MPRSSASAAASAGEVAQEISAWQVVVRQAAATTGSMNPAKKTAPSDRKLAHEGILLQRSTFSQQSYYEQKSNSLLLNCAKKKKMQHNLFCTANQAMRAVVRFPIVTLYQRICLLEN
jgi:hypothetical protein